MKWTKRQSKHRLQLTRLGWDVDTRADLRRARADFRYGWAQGPKLRKGQRKRFDEALDEASHRRKIGKPTASRHFSFHEMTCNGPANDRGCRRIHVDRKLLIALDKLRNKMGRPLKVMSPYRCPVHNARVRGAKLSQHVKGRAFDPAVYVGSAAWVKSLGIFTGIGYQGGTGSFRHGDVRPGNPKYPVTWPY